MSSYDGVKQISRILTWTYGLNPYGFQERGKKIIEKKAGRDLSRIFARETHGFIFTMRTFFLPSKRVLIAFGIGTFLLNLSDEEPSHFLTTPLVRYIALLSHWLL